MTGSACPPLKLNVSLAEVVGTALARLCPPYRAVDVVGRLSHRVL